MAGVILEFAKQCVNISGKVRKEQLIAMGGLDFLLNLTSLSLKNCNWVSTPNIIRNATGALSMLWFVCLCNQTVRLQLATYIHARRCLLSCDDDGEMCESLLNIGALDTLWPSEH